LVGFHHFGAELPESASQEVADLPVVIIAAAARVNGETRFHAGKKHNIMTAPGNCIIDRTVVKTIPFARPSLGSQEAASLKEALASGWVGAGIYPRLFEERVARASGVPYACAVNSGSAALHLALKVLDLRGAEVLTTPLTVPATNNAILHNGATPVFCDVEPATGNIAPSGLAARLTRKTKAILVVHFNGHPCDMDPILALARARRLAVVEDACAAFPQDGAYRGRPLGSMGDLGCFSFSGLKNLTALDGGALVHRKKSWSERLRRLKANGLQRGEVSEAGHHFRMSDLSAALGLAQWDRWPEFAARLKRVAAAYRAGLEGVPDIGPPFDEDYASRALSYFPVRVRGGKKAALRAFLADKGIEAGDWIIPNHHFALYRRFARRLPVAEGFASELLYLPFYPALEEREVSRIVDALRLFARGRKGGHTPPPRRTKRTRRS